MGRTQLSRQKVRCPECLAPIYLKLNAELWSPITCPECHTSLEVVSLQPLMLDYLIDDEDDDDWDEEYDYDD